MTVPDHEGFFWAKQIAVTPGTADEQDFEPSDRWEVVEVYDNGGEAGGPDERRVFVLGVERTQCLINFIWGPEVFPPAAKAGEA